MTNLRSLAFFGIAAFALTTAACGGRQEGAGRMSSNLESALHAVPANAAFAVALQMDQQSESSLPSLSAAMGGLGGSSWLSSAVEFQNASDSAYFLYEDALWMVLLQDDPGAVIDALRAGYDVEERRLGGRTVLRQVELDDSGATDVTIVGRHLVIRKGTNASTEQVDVQLVRLANGWRGTGTLVSSAKFTQAASRVGGTDIQSVMSIDLAGLNGTLRAVEGTAFDLNQFIDGFNAGGVDASECSALEARILTNFPGSLGITAKTASGETKFYGLASLSEEARTRAAQLFPGAPQLAGIQSDVLFGGGLSFDYGTFLTSMKAEPRHIGCGGIAGLAGAVASTARDMNTQIQVNRRTISGTVGILVQDVDFSGFVPTLSAAMVIHSPNAPALVDRAVRILNQIGSGDVVSDASIPTLQYNLTALPMRVRVMQGGDRVVLALGNVRESTQQALLTAPVRQSGSSIFNFFVNGARIRGLANEVESYLREMEVVEAEVIDSNQGVFDMLENATDASIQTFITDQGFETTGTVDAP